ncbi:MAG TPA: CinA family nicotinamide mononucleotide deamidase-related protein, partial [Trueperaceae bacterium]
MEDKVHPRNSTRSAELLSVGTELLLGEIIDTNSAWLARDLKERGLDVYWSARVGDNLGRIKAAIEAALRRSDLLVMCGGLGPTDDDLSREAIAEVFGETPQLDPQLEIALRQRFSRLGRGMPESNLKQAWLIASAEPLPNPVGSAPGWLVRRAHPDQDEREQIVVALPGPPREMEKMWLEQALPRLQLPSSALVTRTYKTFGLGESGVAERLGDLTRQANPSVATYARADGVHVRVAAKAMTRQAAMELAAPALERVEAKLGGLIWGTDSDTLPALILRELRARGLSLAGMESLTGGTVGAALTGVAGASASYRGGMVAYTLQAKAAFGVSEALLETHGSISREAALAMAEAAALQLAADIGLATTGVA